MGRFLAVVGVVLLIALLVRHPVVVTDVSKFATDLLDSMKR